MVAFAPLVKIRERFNNDTNQKWACLPRVGLAGVEKLLELVMPSSSTLISIGIWSTVWASILRLRAGAKAYAAGLSALLMVIIKDYKFIKSW